MDAKEDEHHLHLKKLHTFVHLESEGSFIPSEADHIIMIEMDGS